MLTQKFLGTTSGYLPKLQHPHTQHTQHSINQFTIVLNLSTSPGRAKSPGGAASTTTTTTQLSTLSAIFTKPLGFMFSLFSSLVSLWRAIISPVIIGVTGPDLFTNNKEAVPVSGSPYIQEHPVGTCSG